MAMRAGLLSVLLIVATAVSAQDTQAEKDLRVADADNAAALQVSQADRRFLQLAIDSSAKEIQLSQRALAKSESAEVKRFAEKMVQDHGATNRELMSLNEALLGEQGPPFKRASSKVKREVDQLSQLAGAEFDRRYMAIMIKDHRNAVDLFAQQAERGQNPELKALARKTLPTLEGHLEMAEEIGSK